MSANGRKTVVIDGANVAYEERSAGGKPKLSNLLKVRRELEERGQEAVIIVDASPALKGAEISVDNIMLSRPLKAIIGEKDRYSLPFYVDPGECIDCGACIPACTSDAIFPLDEVPADKRQFIAINEAYFAA